MVDHRTHPDIIWIERLAKDGGRDEEGEGDSQLKRSIGVDQIRELQHRLTMQPSMGPKRAVIIDAADDFERGAANALLKSLEEPPVGTTFLLISHASDRLLPTIRSRCQLLRFERLGEAEMAQALRGALPDADEAEIARLVEAGDGAPGQAIAYAGLDLGEIEGSIDKIIETGDPHNAIRHQLAEALALKAAQPRYEAFLRRVPLRIASFARSQTAADAMPAVEAFGEADNLARRAVALSLDKTAVVMQMGSLLASLHLHGAQN